MDKARNINVLTNGVIDQAALEAALHDLSEGQKAIVERLTMLESSISKRLDYIDGQLKTLHEAFPDDDVHAHRIYHKSLIEKEEAKKRLYESLVIKMWSGTLWGTTVFIIYSIWNYIKIMLMTGHVRP